MHVLQLHWYLNGNVTIMLVAGAHTHRLKTSGQLRSGIQPNYL